MGAHRELAIAAMKIRTQESIQKDFMGRSGANLYMPAVPVKGALPAMVRQEAPARVMQMLVDLIMYFGIGNYQGESDYSDYYDPGSPWYNVFYGVYALRSYKLDKLAWGYTRADDGSIVPDFDEFLRVPAVDYNFFQAGQFGCPTEKMCFDPKWTPANAKVTDRSQLLAGSKRDGPVEPKTYGWDAVTVETCVPSGLHDPTVSLGEPGSYILYGIPARKLLEGREPYEPVPMKGQMLMRQIPKSRIPSNKIPQPVTLAFGVLCPDTLDGQDLMRQIMVALWDKYYEIGGPLEGPPG